MEDAMKTILPRVFVVLVLPLAIGCGEEQCAAACLGEGIAVSMDPSVTSTYDVDLLLDGVVGAFTCTESAGAWTLTNPTGSVPVDGCAGFEFAIDATPTSVEISVNAKDGSWTGSVTESPRYERNTVCGTLCPPRATVTVAKQ
jgi:hypothetical protein